MLEVGMEFTPREARLKPEFAEIYPQMEAGNLR